MSPYPGETARVREVRPAEAVGFVVSDLAVLQSLQSRYARRPLSADQLRTAKLAALVAFIRAVESDIAGQNAPWTVEFPLDPEPLARLVGSQPAQAAAAVGHLREAGVLHQVESAGSVWYRISESVFERAASAAELDWSAILARLEGEPAALLVARAFADLLSGSLTDWASIRVSALAEHTGYGSITVRKGKDVLVQSGLIEEDASPGQTSRYRFTAFARGLSEAPAPRTTAASPPGGEARPDGPVRATPGLPERTAPIAPGAVPAEIAGLKLELPAGTMVRLEIAADGRQLFRIGDHLVIGPL